jgi:hypothetical protein
MPDGVMNCQIIDTEGDLCPKNKNKRGGCLKIFI